MNNNFEEKILIASPTVLGIFRHTVLYIYSNNELGSMGAILNVRMDSTSAKNWSDSMLWPYPEKIHIGGPVEKNLGYVIHTNDYATRTTVPFNDYYSFTGGKNIITDICDGNGPNKFSLMVGYCAWQARQLEDEIERGTWIVSDFDEDSFFQDSDREVYWEHVMHIAAQQRTEKLLEIV